LSALLSQDTQLLELPENRRLGFQILGLPGGAPVFFCHGFPGSRLDARLFEEAARQLGVRLISADRPGCGLSDFLPGRSIADWAADVRTLADHLRLDRFAVLGLSGGGPYAMATAIGLPDRISRLGLVCPLGSLARPDTTGGMGSAQTAMIRLTRTVPGLARWLNTWLTGPVMRRIPALALGILSQSAPTSDRQVLADPDVRARLLASIREAFRHGGRGPAWDLHLFTRDPGPDPARISSPTLLWHGEADTTVPVAFGHDHAARIPGCQARFLPKEGHFSLPVHHGAEILRDLVADIPSTARLR
jgi:pimeloyl-ACP methyl ester carboxylesterase